MANGTGLSGIEKVSVIITAGMVIALGILAWLSTQHVWWLWLAASVGGLGGLVHEIAQSGGKVLFFQRHEDGLYLGALAGIVLGAVAGILVIRGHLIFSATGATLSAGTVQISYEVFTAGLALKGVTEAAGGNPVK